ncbi:uncharacterized protein LOC111131265 [Crassostrea virginica]
MYNPSKRLQAIRRQLMQMDEQYKNGIDPGSHTGSESHTGSNANATPEKAQHMASNVNFMLSSTAAGHEQSGTIDNSMEFENEIETTDDCSSNNDDNDIPLSEELRTAILNIEDLDDMDNLVDNVISAVQVDASCDTDLENLEHSITLPDEANASMTVFSTASTLSTGNLQETYACSNTMFMSAEEEESWRKSRRKKDNHNIIERRRRYNINDRIKELSSLLPAIIPSELKKNKGSILKATVGYIKELKIKEQKMHYLEDSKKHLHNKYQKLLFRTFQSELKLKLHGLTEDSDDVLIKRKKRRFTDIDAIVERFCKQNIHQGLQTIEKSAPTRKKNTSSAVGTCHEHERNGTENVKNGLRQHINRKMAAEKPGSDNIFEVSEFFWVNESQNNVPDRKSPMISQLSAELPRKQSLQSGSISNTSDVNKDDCNPQEKEEVIELSTEQCNFLLNLFENHGNVNEILINENDMTQPDEDLAIQECLSPVTSASNMLEKMLRVKDGNSDASGLEDSTESNKGLR